jgi:nucleotide-binding universal stress UspA family protein
MTTATSPSPAPARPLVLVPVDFSVCSHEVAAEAARLASGVEGEVVFLHVVPTPPGLPDDVVVRPEPGGPPVSVHEWLEAEAARELPVYLRSMNRLGVPARTAVRHGPVADLILETADQEDAKYIVMGTHGRRGLARMFLGSVAEQVVRRSERPVVTLRSQHKETCQARSCATCTSGQLKSADQVDAEQQG